MYHDLEIDRLPKDIPDEYTIHIYDNYEISFYTPRTSCWRKLYVLVDHAIIYTTVAIYFPSTAE